MGYDALLRVSVRPNESGTTTITIPEIPTEFQGFRSLRGSDWAEVMNHGRIQYIEDIELDALDEMDDIPAGFKEFCEWCNQTDVSWFYVCSW
jgi:hypothetical protein